MCLSYRGIEIKIMWHLVYLDMWLETNVKIGIILFYFLNDVLHLQ